MRISDWSSDVCSSDLKLGAHTQALQYYEKAVGILENARKRMNEAMVSIKQGRMVETIVRRDLDSEAGWDWILHDLPEGPETCFLQNMHADHRFQEALEHYRDIRIPQTKAIGRTTVMEKGGHEVIDSV